jgi:hypothetical protein
MRTKISRKTLSTKLFLLIKHWSNLNQVSADQNISTKPDQNISTKPDQNISTKPDQNISTKPDQNMNTSSLILTLIFSKPMPKWPSQS